MGFKIEGLGFRIWATGFGRFAKLEVVQDTRGMCGILRGVWCHQKGFRRECYRNYCVVRTHGAKSVPKGPMELYSKYLGPKVIWEPLRALSIYYIPTPKPQTLNPKQSMHVNPYTYKDSHGLRLGWV